MAEKTELKMQLKRKCSCKGDNLDKFVQPNILLELTRGKLHGYLLIQELEKKSLFCGNTLDNAGVYRTLKSMESRNLIRSEWDMEDPGPAKKVYMITPEGLQCLGNWLRTLEDYRAKVDELIDEIKNAVKG
ncbi:MAG: helix-turn-helix transcriptional regulator [Bacillota bacterium]